MSVAFTIDHQLNLGLNSSMCLRRTAHSRKGTSRYRAEAVWVPRYSNFCFGVTIRYLVGSSVQVGAAVRAVQGGVLAAVIASGADLTAIDRIMRGERVGTLFLHSLESARKPQSMGHNDEDSEVTVVGTLTPSISQLTCTTISSDYTSTSYDYDDEPAEPVPSPPPPTPLWASMLPTQRFGSVDPLNVLRDVTERLVEHQLMENKKNSFGTSVIDDKYVLCVTVHTCCANACSAVSKL
jgi:hypothetical protein